MNKTTLLTLVAAVTLSGGLLLVGNLYADRDEHYERENEERYERERDEGHERDRGERYEGRERGEEEGGEILPNVKNRLYKEECSSCHFLYQPGLLPARSWERIMDASHDHFGEDLFLDRGTLDELKSFLRANPAEGSRSGLSYRVLRSLAGAAPLKITEVPYIKREHREIRADVFKREAVVSFSNCSACHKTAERGDFEEDSVRIPR